MSARAAWSSILRTFRTFRTTFLAGFLVFFTVLMAMGPFGFLVIPGVVGGAIAALIMLRRHRFGSQPATYVPSTEEFPPTDVINAAHIRVAGIGGLGLVAMAVVVGLAFPLTRFAMIAGLIGGAFAAWAIVRYRERHGPMSSSDRGLPGARTVFVDDNLPGREGPALHVKDSELQSGFVTPAVVKTA